MVNIHVQAAAFELLPLLSDKTYALHSCFENGCNLIIENKLCFIGNKSNCLLPYGLLIAQRDLRLFRKQLQQSQTPFRWQDKEQYFETPGLRLSLGKARLYDSRFFFKNAPLPHDSLSLLKRNVDLSLKTGFGPTIGELTASKNPSVEALIKGCCTQDPRQAAKTLNSWMGRGLGLTPSGDDFLLGILFINRIYPILSPSFYHQLKTFTEEKIYTTDISNHFYQCAFNHLFSQIFVDLYDALDQADPHLLKKGIQQMLSIGHTSGRDMLAGIFVGLSMLPKAS